MKNKGDSKSIKEWLVNKHFVSIFIFTSALMIINEPSLMNTLFPYCVPWMYYGFSNPQIEHTVYSQSEDSSIPPHSDIRPSHNSSSYPSRYQSSPVSSSQVSAR